MVSFNEMKVHTIGALAVVITLLLNVARGDTHTTEGCSRHQYVEIGKEGTIKCSFRGNTYSILWYDKTYHADDKPILKLLNLEKTGDGYETKEYDISDDGSLIIRNVTLNHEGTYSVKRLTTSFAPGEVTEVSLRVVVKPSQYFPAISGCPKEEDFCFTELQEMTSLNCFVECARPAVTVTWLDETLTNTSSTSNVSTCLGDEITNKTFESYATISYPTEEASLLSLLICNATDQAGVFTKPRSLILVEKRMHGPYRKSPTTVYAELHSTLHLTCSDGYENLIVWKKGNETGYPTDIIAFAEFQRYNVTRVFFDDVRMNSSATLSLRRMEVKDEGMYFCITRDDVISYKVIVKVPPRPPYLVVPGCGHQQYCVLDVERQGNLTCKVQGIRPPVQLEWVPYRANVQVAFKSIDAKVEIKGDTFDITHTSAYIADPSLETVTVECRVKEPDDELFDLATRLDLFFLYEMTAKQGVSYDEPHYVFSVSHIVLMVMILILVLLLLVLNLLLLKKSNLSGRTLVNGNETT